MEQRKIFNYTISGNKYTQQELVLGQIEQLMTLLQGTMFSDALDVSGIVMAIGGKISSAIAIVIKQEDQALEDKDVEGLTKRLKFNLNMDKTLQIIEDFFFCNQIASLLSRLEKTATTITAGLSQTGKTG